jgi:hypothetical protein
LFCERLIPNATLNRSAQANIELSDFVQLARECRELKINVEGSNELSSGGIFDRGVLQARP